MSLDLSENPIIEKLTLLIKLIKLYEKNLFNADEIHYLMDIIVGLDISKSYISETVDILEYLQTVVNIDFAYYTSYKEDLITTPELFGPDVLKEKLINLRHELEKYLNSL